MKKAIFALCTMAIFTVSCKKDDPAPPVDPGATKFMTLTAGASWNYETIDNLLSSTSTFTRTSTNRDSTINGKSYHVFTNSNGNSDYYAISGNDYLNYASLTAPLDPVEFLYLKDNVAVGGNWSQSVPVSVPGLPFPLTATVTNTVLEKGGSLVVNGTTYTNVIKVKTDISVAGIPASAISTNINSYFAPKFGQIKSDAQIDIDYSGFVNNTNTTTNLVSATIP